MSVPAALLGQDIAADANGNTANADKIANTDNLWFSESMRTLFIGEDSGMHINNFVWAYNVDTKSLSRVFSAPSGAECTGLQVVDNLNGFAYVMSNFQHPGDWEAIHTTALAANGATLNATINTNWGDKKKGAVGYLSGMPSLG
jgi:secreted PhoX family phosphatase